VTPRVIDMHEVLRYGRRGGPTDVVIDGFPNYFFLTASQGSTLPRMMLESGINGTASVDGPDGRRRPVIAIRSSPWKAGHASNPWHDEFDLDHGHVRYYGDHKPGTVGLPGSTTGNRALLDAWRLHAGTDREQRLLAPPLLLFRSVTVYRNKRAIAKGHVEFCGAAVIERLEQVVQRDPETGRSFPNLALDLVVVDLAPAGDVLDMRWIDDRRDCTLALEETLRFAPESWRHWVKGGRAALPGIRRRVMSSRVLSREAQMPVSGTVEEEALLATYSFFNGQKHAFELLAARVAALILGDRGGHYREGWLTRAGGDGGLDFVGRLDVGAPGANMPLVVLGQAKCVLPGSSISPDQVARLVARLRRGWIGVFVTTSSFSRQAQIEVIDDEYPIVLVSGLRLAESVLRMAAADHGGDVASLLAASVEGYGLAITHRRPDEVLAL
jgi:hypothetical protein